MTRNFWPRFDRHLPWKNEAAADDAMLYRFGIIYEAPETTPEQREWLLARFDAWRAQIDANRLWGPGRDGLAAIRQVESEIAEVERRIAARRQPVAARGHAREPGAA